MLGTEAAPCRKEERVSVFDHESAVALARALVDRLPDPDLRAAYLFGSFAWGDADAASDLDIGLLFDRPVDDRAVVRVRVADAVPDVPPHAPLFADLSHMTVARFEEGVARGHAGARLAHAAILRDSAGWLAAIREQVAPDFLAPEARAARWRARAEQARAHRAAAGEARDDDPILAALEVRLALEAALGGAIEADGGRLSLTHFLESGEHALGRIGLSTAMATFRDLLGLDATEATIAASLNVYRQFADTMISWLADPAIHSGLPAADHAWAVLTHAPETYAEIDHKVGTLPPVGRMAALQFYLDGLLTTVIRMNVGKVVRLRAGGTARIPTVSEFHRALHTESDLLRAWVAALRLEHLAARLPEALTLTDTLLADGPSLEVISGERAERLA